METAMDYATMNEVVSLLKVVAGLRDDEADAKLEEAARIRDLIRKIDSQYPKPEEEK